MTPNAIILIDVQEKLFPAMEKKEALQNALLLLLKGAAVLKIPVIVTEQYPKGLGPTIPEIKEALGNADVLEKTAFSAGGAAGFWEKLKTLNVKHAAVCGIETHVCVYQTVRDLMEKNISVDVVENAVSSRFKTDRKIGLKHLASLGAGFVSVEMILFEAMGDAKHQAFKEISALVKQYAAKK